MNTFALHDITTIKGKITFKKLVIDEHCAFDEFCKEIEEDGNLKKQLIGIYSIMDQVANMQRLPKEKFRDITPKKDTVKEYEFKKNDLRVYVIKDGAHIVILGGKKGSQHEDIKLFRSIKKRYLDSKI